MEQVTKEIALAPSVNSFKSRLDSHLEDTHRKTHTRHTQEGYEVRLVLTSNRAAINGGDDYIS